MKKIAIVSILMFLIAMFAGIVRAGKQYGKTIFMDNVSVGSWSAMSGMTLGTTIGGTYTNGTYTNYYRISGTNLNGRLPVSTNCVITFTGNTNTTNAVLVTWARYDGISSYVIEQSHDAGSTWTNWLVAGTANATNWTDLGTNTWYTNSFTSAYSVISSPTYPWSDAHLEGVHIYGSNGLHKADYGTGGSALTNAAANHVAYDTINIGAGEYNVGTTVLYPAEGATWNGIRGATKIITAATGSSGAVRCQSNNITIANITIEATATIGPALAALSGCSNLYVNNCHLISTAEYSSGFRAWDGSLDNRIHNTKIEGYGIGAALLLGSGPTTFETCEITATEDEFANSCVSSSGAGADGTFINCKIWTQGTNTGDKAVNLSAGAVALYHCVITSGTSDYDLHQSGGTLTEYGCHYDSAKTSGTITHGDSTVVLNNQDNTFADGKKISIDEIRARDSGGLKLYPDGGTGLAVNDDGSASMDSGEPFYLLGSSASTTNISIYAEPANSRTVKREIKPGTTNYIYSNFF